MIRKKWLKSLKEGMLVWFINRKGHYIKKEVISNLSGSGIVEIEKDVFLDKNGEMGREGRIEPLTQKELENIERDKDITNIIMLSNSAFMQILNNSIFGLLRILDMEDFKTMCEIIKRNVNRK